VPAVTTIPVDDGSVRSATKSAVASFEVGHAPEKALASDRNESAILAVRMGSPPFQGLSRSPWRRQYVKLCDLADFDDTGLRRRIRDIVPNHEPRAEVRRKFWEYAMLTLFLEDAGALHDHTQVLSVGAGHEEVLFWLANRVGKVVAIDIYGEGGFARQEADAAMLTNPKAFAPYPYREDRLKALKMDARALRFPDASFDVVFSLSSIEHFGAHGDVARAAREIGRVLRPGGLAFIVTECFVARHPLNSPILQTAIRIATLGRRCANATPRRRAVDVFTSRELQRWIIQPSGLELVQPLDLTLSPETWQNVIIWRGQGEFEASRGDPWPHILLQPQGSAFFLRGGAAAFTSAALAMQKRDGVLKPAAENSVS
jgi:SAM-dependent methyltransferase